MNSKRNFLRQISTTALAIGAVPPLLSRAMPLPPSDSIEIPGKDSMILRSYRFLDLETPVEFFNTWLTPVPRFFVRNHMHPPNGISADDWQTQATTSCLERHEARIILQQRRDKPPGQKKSIGW
jgi:hypothetical protein